MKNTKKTIIASIFTLLGLFSFAQNQETITLVCSKNLDDATELFVDLHGNVQTETWNKNHIRIVLKIETNGVTREVVKHLVAKKRFKIDSYKTNQKCLKLINPNITLPVYINGQKLKEKITYQIFVPRNTLITIHSEKETSNTLASANL